MKTNILICLAVLTLLMTSVVLGETTTKEQEKKEINENNSNYNENNEDPGFFGVVMQILALLFEK